jgi:hypothetical protein
MLAPSIACVHLIAEEFATKRCAGTGSNSDR